VWAVSWERAPDYWFPRQCPRAMAWRAPWSSEDDVRAILGPSVTAGREQAQGTRSWPARPSDSLPASHRVHAIEYGWLESMRETRLYAYRFAEADFTPFGNAESAHAMVCDHEVAPLGPPERVGDLFALHDEAGIELRLLSNLWPFWEAVVASTLDFSGIRLRNARARPE